jgi:hypothetical protein
MRISPRFQLLSALLALSLAAACDDPDPAKMVAVDNQTDAPHEVTFGITHFGTVAAHTTSDYMEVGDGTEAVLVDGREVWRDSLGSDNVGGSWTLYLQPFGSQLVVGVALDE